MFSNEKYVCFLYLSHTQMLNEKCGLRQRSRVELVLALSQRARAVCVMS